MKRSLLMSLFVAGMVRAEPVADMRDLLAVEAKVQAVAQKCVPLTVALSASDASSSGSGVLVSDDGLILTAAHVVQGSDDVAQDEEEVREGQGVAGRRGRRGRGWAL